MKLFLDAHISGKRVGSGLRRCGHEVRAVDEEPALEGLDDADLLQLAAQDGRIMVTCNVRDFLPLVAERASLNRDHCGVLLVARSIRHDDFGVLVGSVHEALRGTVQRDWLNRVAWVRRG